MQNSSISRGMSLGTYARLPSSDPGVTSLELGSLRSHRDADDKEQVKLEMPDAMDSRWRVVEMSWFQLLAALVIIVNIVTILMELDDPRKKSLLFVPDQLILCFYVVELACRLLFFRGRFFEGSTYFVVCNVLDVVVLAVGIVDGWLLPLLPAEMRRSQAVQVTFSTLRLLRLFRVFKIIRVFVDTDLSWAEGTMFQSFIGCVIAFNSILMGLETDVEWAGWFYIEQVLLSIYVFELVVRLKGSGVFFISRSNPDIVWNTLDFLIVVSSMLDSWVAPFIGLLHRLFTHSQHSDAKEPSSVSLGQAMMLLRMLRLLRVLRLLKLVKAVRPLYNLVTGIAATVQGVFWVLIFVFTAVYAMGIVATRLIGHGMIFVNGKVPEQIFQVFSSVPVSMFTLFRCMSGSSTLEESAALDELTRDFTIARFGFVFFMVFSSWTLLSILTAVVSENMITTTGAQQLEMKIMASEEDRRTHIEQLNQLFLALDEDGDGFICAGELDNFLEDSSIRRETARTCRVPVRDVKEVLKTLHHYTDEVTLDDFVDSLVEVSKPVTEKSVMKLEAMITLQQRQLEAAQATLAQSIAEVVKRIAAHEERSLAAILDLRSVAEKVLVQDPIAGLVQALKVSGEDAARSMGDISAGFQDVARTNADMLDAVRQMAAQSRTDFAEACALTLEQRCRCAAAEGELGELTQLCSAIEHEPGEVAESQASSARKPCLPAEEQFWNNASSPATKQVEASSRSPRSHQAEMSFLTQVGPCTAEPENEGSFQSHSQKEEVLSNERACSDADNTRQSTPRV